MTDAMKILCCLRRLLRDRSGFSAITYALCMVPVVGIFGVALDYGNTLSYRQKLDAAADAASLQAVNTARAQILANPTQSETETQSLAVVAGLNAFKANAGAALTSLDSNSPTVTLTISDSNPLTMTVTGTAKYNASVTTFFGKLIGASFQTFSFTGNSQSSTVMANYVGYYLLIDVSGSMGTPSTVSGQTALAKINPDDLSEYPGGCMFACHFSGYKGYAYSRTNSASSTAKAVANNYCAQPDTSSCIQLRIDAVATALKAFMSSAQSAKSYDNQIAVGLYPFIVNLFQYYPASSAGSTLSTDLSTSSTAANCIPGLLDNGGATNTGLSSNCANSAKANVTMSSGGTHIGNAFSQLYKLIPQPFGDGSSEDKRKPIVFLITDGADDEQVYKSGSWSGSNHATTVASSYCKQFTDAGIGLYILNIPYQTIANANANFAGNEDGYANSNIPSIAPSLQACVTSQSNYFQADPYNPDSITDQIQAMFAQSLQATRLVK